jgi:hypothetical protein
MLNDFATMLTVDEGVRVLAVKTCSRLSPQVQITFFAYLNQRAATKPHQLVAADGAQNMGCTGVHMRPRFLKQQQFSPSHTQHEAKKIC